MTDDFFLFTMTGIIMAEICIIAYLKYAGSTQQATSARPKEKVAAVESGRYQGTERRARKRSSGALYQRPEGDWVFH